MDFAATCNHISVHVVCSICYWKISVLLQLKLSENPKHVQPDMKGLLLVLSDEVIEDTCAHLWHRAPFVTCMSVNEFTSPWPIHRRLLMLQLSGEMKNEEVGGESVSQEKQEENVFQSRCRLSAGETLFGNAGHNAGPFSSCRLW